MDNEPPTRSIYLYVSQRTPVHERSRVHNALRHKETFCARRPVKWRTALEDVFGRDFGQKK